MIDFKSIAGKNEFQIHFYDDHILMYRYYVVSKTDSGYVKDSGECIKVNFLSNDSCELIGFIHGNKKQNQIPSKQWWQEKFKEPSSSYEDFMISFEKCINYLESIR